MPGPTGASGRGPYHHVVPVWKGAAVVNVGDFVYRDSSGYDRSAADFTWDTNIATTSAEFRGSFRGVSDARRIAGQTTDGGKNHGMILASGEFKKPLDVTATAIQVVGSFVSIAKAAGNNLDPTKVTLTATISNAIGRLSDDVRIGDTYATFVINPSHGGWQDGVLSYYDNGSLQTVGVTASVPTG